VVLKPAMKEQLHPGDLKVTVDRPVSKWCLDGQVHSEALLNSYEDIRALSLRR
jgi:hypothetical protein